MLSLLVLQLLFSYVRTTIVGINSPTSCDIMFITARRSELMGSDCTVGSHLPLWYAAYPRPPVTKPERCEQFSPFGGWGSPFAWQYNDAGPSCSTGADVSVLC
jgi:hypothetical protein